MKVFIIDYNDTGKIYVVAEDVNQALAKFKKYYYEKFHEEYRFRKIEESVFEVVN